MINTTSDSKTKKEISDSVLVSAAQHNPKSFAKLYDRYVQPIYKYLYSRTSNQKLAEDLTSETFLSALEALKKYRNTGSFSAWLFSIARNKLMDHFRNNGKQSVTLDAADIFAGNSLTPPEEIIKKETSKNVSSILNTLDDEEIELLRLRFSTELRFAEIAVQLDKSEDAVKKTYYRLMDRIKSKMEVVNVCQ
jgi:RNA polymerase sigma-70 factor (ECF subfamily)